MCRKKETLQGSITVFASMSLLLVASFLLVLLEAARVKGLEAYGRIQRTNAMEAVFSEYDRDLFERYGIFLLDGSYGEQGIQFSRINGRLQSVSQQNLRPEIPAQSWNSVQNFYQMDVTDASVTGYLLATDYDGGPFREMAVASLKASYPTELAQKLYDGLQSSHQAMTQAEQSRSAMDQAQENIQAAKEKQEQEKQAQEEASGEAEETQAASEDAVENPMDIVKAWKQADILTLVMPSTSQVSAKEIRGKETLEHRRLSQGNEAWTMSGDWYKKVLYQQFIQMQFACYGADVSGEGALDYELEYIHSGKKSDRENLKSVVQQILLMREGINFIYLQTDAVKQQEAYQVAVALAAALGIAPAAGLIAQGILAAWAYAESILDVRALLAGGKIPWIKTSESWSSSLSGLGELLTGSAQAKKQENGEDYRGYLEKLLWLNTERALNYRAMDLIELRAEADGSDPVQMDEMILALRADLVYEAEALFSKMVTVKPLQTDRWEFSDTVYDSYLSKE